MTLIKGASSLTYKEAVDISKRLPGYKHLIPAGSVASKQPIANDLDFITTIPLDKYYAAFNNAFPKTWRDTSIGEKRFDFYPIIGDKKLVINIWYAKKDELPTFYFAYAYPRQFVIAMRRRAKTMNMQLNQYGIYLNGKKIAIDNVKKIFDILDLPYRSPQQEFQKHPNSGK